MNDFMLHPDCQTVYATSTLCFFETKKTNNNSNLEKRHPQAVPPDPRGASRTWNAGGQHPLDWSPTNPSPGKTSKKEKKNG